MNTLDPVNSSVLSSRSCTAHVNPVWINTFYTCVEEQIRFCWSSAWITICTTV